MVAVCGQENLKRRGSGGENEGCKNGLDICFNFGGHSATEAPKYARRYRQWCVVSNFR